MKFYFATIAVTLATGQGRTENGKKHLSNQDLRTIQDGSAALKHGGRKAGLRGLLGNDSGLIDFEEYMGEDYEDNAFYENEEYEDTEIRTIEDEVAKLQERISDLEIMKRSGIQDMEEPDTEYEGQYYGEEGTVELAEEQYFIEVPNSSSSEYSNEFPEDEISTKDLLEIDNEMYVNEIRNDEYGSEQNYEEIYDEDSGEGLEDSDTMDGIMTVKDLREIRNGAYESDKEELYGQIENMGNVEEFAEDPYYGEEDVEGGPYYSSDEEQLVTEEPELLNDMMALKELEDLYAEIENMGARKEIIEEDEEHMDGMMLTELREIRNGEYESDAEDIYAKEEELMDMGVDGMFEEDSGEPREANDAEIQSFSSDQCKDLHANCPDWASNGQCYNHPSYMHQYCKESCGKCSYTPLPLTVVTYHKYEEKACRTNQNRFGVQGQDFVLHVYTSEEQCKHKCTNNSQCQAFEWSPYNHGNCEIWYNKPVEFEWKLSFNCHVKAGSSN